MIPPDLHFTFLPAAYLLFFLIIFGILFWQIFRYRQQMLLNFAEINLWESLLFSPSSMQRVIKYGSLCLAWFAATLALMQPEGNAHYSAEAISSSGKIREAQPEMQQLIFLLDASASMAVVDTRIGKSRFDYAKELIKELMEQLQGEMISLYTFTSEVEALVPTTYDYLFAQMFLNEVRINEGNRAGTDFLNALKYLYEQLKTEPIEERKTILLFSDGEEPQIVSTENSFRQRKILEVVDNIHKLNTDIICVGMGTEKGGIVPELIYKGKTVHSSMNPELLKNICDHADGELFLSNEETAMSLSMKIISFLKKGSEESGKKGRRGFQADKALVYDLYYQVPLLFAIVLLAYVLVKDKRFRTGVRENFL